MNDCSFILCLDISIFSEEVMLQSVQNLQTLARLCHSHEPLPDDLASWLASSLECFLEQRAESLNAAFGLQNARRHDALMCAATEDNSCRLIELAFARSL